MRLLNILSNVMTVDKPTIVYGSMFENNSYFLRKTAQQNRLTTSRISADIHCAVP